MEPNITKQAVTMGDVAYEGSLEQSVESDVLLPDYCPDIQKVLRCFCRPVVTDVQTDGDHLTVTLHCLIRVYYLGADQSIRCAEQKLPYTKSCDLRSAAADPVADVTARTDYVNCRAVNQRRFEVRCAVTMECRVFSRTQGELISGAQGCGIQLKTSDCEITRIAADWTRTFSVHEDLQLSSQKPPIQSIIRRSCCCRLSDYKLVGGKMVLKGELVISLLYQPETDGAHPESMEYALPISQLIDAENAGEDSVCDVQLVVLESDVSPKPDSDGENRLLGLDCTAAVHIRAHRHQRVSFITDCYSTEYECCVERAAMGFLNLIRAADERCMHKCTVELPSETDSVLDAFCLVTETSVRVEQSAAVVCAKLTIGVFVLCGNGNILYTEQCDTCETRIPLDNASEVLFSPRAEALSCSFSMAGAQSIDCRCEIVVGGCIYARIRPSVVTAVFCDTDRPKHRGTDASLIIYYADAGEDVWEIAKRYNTSPDAVMSENALDASVLNGKQMLLIPVV